MFGAEGCSRSTWVIPGREALDHLEDSIELGRNARWSDGRSMVRSARFMETNLSAGRAVCSMGSMTRRGALDGMVLALALEMV